MAGDKDTDKMISELKITPKTGSNVKSTLTKQLLNGGGLLPKSAVQETREQTRESREGQEVREGRETRETQNNASLREGDSGAQGKSGSTGIPSGTREGRKVPGEGSERHELGNSQGTFPADGRNSGEVREVFREQTRETREGRERPGETREASRESRRHELFTTHFFVVKQLRDFWSPFDARVLGHAAYPEPDSEEACAP
jgi:hypothetical protein